MPDLFVSEDKPTPEATLPDKSRAKNSLAHTDHIEGGTPLAPFASLCIDPQGLTFEHQEPQEEIHLFLRRHFVTNVPWLFTTVVLALVPIPLALLLSFLPQTGLIIPSNYIVILLSFYYLFLLGYAFVHFVTWFYNIGIVTNLRVIDIDVSNVTHKNVATTEVADLVDVEYSQRGFLQNFFNFGDVKLQTEGIKPNFEFQSVPSPGRVSDIISDLMRGVKHE